MGSEQVVLIVLRKKKKKNPNIFVEVFEFHVPDQFVCNNSRVIYC